MRKNQWVRNVEIVLRTVAIRLSFPHLFACLIARSSSSAAPPMAAILRDFVRHSKKMLSILWKFARLAAVACSLPIDVDASPREGPEESGLAAYLLVYFKDDTHSLHFALSTDGYSFTDINRGNPVIDGRRIAEQKGVRDPYIMRGPDGIFHLAATDLHIYGRREGLRDTDFERPRENYGWGNNRAIVMMKSNDLIEWSHSVVRIDQSFPGLDEIGCAWAPELIFDEKKDRMMLYFTMRFGNGRNNMVRAYLNEDLSALATRPESLFDYPNDTTCIDGDITRVGDRYHLFYVAHDGTPGIKQAVSERVDGGYVYDPAWYDSEKVKCEAPHVWKRIGEEKWILMYDIYGLKPPNFGFRETRDFKVFKDLGRFNEGVMKATNFDSPKHPSLVRITRMEARKLADHWKYTLVFDR